MKTPTRPAPAKLQPLAVDARRLAELLTVSVRTIRTMDVAGKLPKPIRLNGRAVRWVLEGPNGIRAWLDADCPGRRTWEALKGNGRAPG